MKEKHVLVIEDEERIQMLVSKYLEIEGYQYTCLSSAEGAMECIQSENPDIIVLDIMLPGESGLKLCQKIRETSNIPIIFLTALADEADNLLGFKMGADDYVSKPFSPGVLMARIAAVLKRTQQVQQVDRASYGPITLDNNTREVTVSSREIRLTVNEFAILKAFLEDPEKVFTRQLLLLATKQVDSEIYHRTIDTHIKNLRKKIAEANEGKHYIKSIYGIGYQLTLED